MAKQTKTDAEKTKPELKTSAGEAETKARAKTEAAEIAPEAGQAAQSAAEGAGKMIPIYIMGKEYLVPETVTILKAFEYSGYRFIRGCGCRGGICGACATVYRTAGDYRIKVGLACQTVVEEGMYLTQIPFYPANKAEYCLEELEPTVNTLMKLYPEMARCVSCNSCGKICPQDIKVMDYVTAALRGNIKKPAELSFECIMCGLCASRCPAEIVQYYIGILCRRLYSRHIAKQAEDLEARVREIEKGKFVQEFKELKSASEQELMKLYAERDMETVG
jgi:formate hydrogenlyase subunit 6/NADH:ubiquinone oxidoreductase subunit I